MAEEWKFDVPTAGTKHLPPDPRYMEALTSQGYGFEAAIADLVDNSIDAGATDVVIHFLRDDDRLVSLLIVDNGHGMTDAELDVAMTIGGRRDYGHGALGMFGTGLKSASLSHAAAVTVVSRTKMSRPAGRRWVMEHAKDGFECDIVEPAYAQTLIDRYSDGQPIRWNGTVVRWDGVKDFPRNGGPEQTERYVARTIAALGMHLGLQLHRFLVRGDFNITIAVEDIVTGMIVTNYGVNPVDPFGYPVSGNPEYPCTFKVDVPSVGVVALQAHIWPPKSTVAQFRGIGSLIDTQGFYLYRNDRLVQAGGWNNFRQPEQHLALARVAVELPSTSSDVFRLTVKKDGVEVSPEFIAALENASDDDGRTFGRFLVDADITYREARRRAGVDRRPVILPGKGLDSSVREVISEELPGLPGEEPIAIRWDNVDGDHFFELDRDHRQILLNQRYRPAILGGRRGGLNDAPMIKSMLYLMVNEVFQRERIGPRDKDNLQLWQSVLVAAARAEMDRLGDRDGE
ncbi:ATP-binding protein [Nocardia tengchongensis]|uniref:ATP-binding protein n=1 Tax=Nocardia tengchongensis TaxID=2055889 RepID=A0ABX8CZI2_9NOCA|nr:ATP-binding protein [Nocardia tengchongensis]QVI25316.1 ATP-binding protein [Nocardia tengchongensis]